MVEDFFDFFNGSDFSISVVIVCIIVFVFFLWCATISSENHKKDVRRKVRDDENEAE